MKNPKFLLSLFIITLFLSVTSCSVEEEVLHREQSIKSNKITFDQFKKETGLKNIQTIKSIIPSFNNQDYNRRIENEFLVNTEVIERCVSQDNQTTYSFKIYPITVDLGEREYYNLVYEKIGTQWNEIIFLNKERANPQVGEAKLEESDMIYNKLGEKTVRNSTITITIHCNGSCAANGYASCDGFACPTGECLQVTVSYDYVPVGFTGGSSSGSVSVGGNPGGGSGFEGIYIPNPYDGDADLDNPDFMLAMNVAAFTRSLPQNLKNVIANNHYAHPLIVDFMRTNGGLTQANKDAVISALTAYAPIPYNANITFWSFATIEQFLVNSFNYLLKNPNQQGQAFVQSLLTPVEAIPDYLNQNTWSEESVQFAIDMINFDMERDWKAEIKQAISTGITSSAELTHKMYSKLSAIAINHPSSISYINTVIDGVRAAASTVIDTNPNTCNWTDLFNMWMFELGNNPLNFNGPSVTVTSLQGQQGVSQARSIALNQIANGNLNPIPPYGWTYGQQAFYNGMANGNIATSFLGSYTTNVIIKVLPNGQHMLTFSVTNPSTWDSATRLRIDNNGDGVHDGIFPNHDRNAPNTLHIGGNFNQKWTWTETY